jgi:hypothetical protein
MRHHLILLARRDASRALRRLARHPRRFVVLLVGGLALAVAASTVTFSAADAMQTVTPPLFVEVADATLTVPVDPTIARARVVTVNFDALAGPMGPEAGAAGSAETVLLNLFPDTQLTAVRDRATGSMPRPGQRLTWIGHVVAAPEDTVLIVAGDGTLAASVQTTTGIYDVCYLDQGYHAVVQVNQGQFGPD